MNVSELIEILKEHLEKNGDGPVAVYIEQKEDPLKVIEEVTMEPLSEVPEEVYGSYVRDDEGTKGLIIWPNEY